LSREWRLEVSERIDDDFHDEKRPDQLTLYGISQAVQKALSEIRTDLDAFSEVEIHTLMASGYIMTSWSFPRSVRALMANPALLHGQSRVMEIS
jgi:hypothetical protein